MSNNSFSGISLTWKLYIPFVCLIILFCGLGIFSLRLLYQLEVVTHGLYSEVAVFAKLADLSRELHKTRYLLGKLALTDSSEEFMKAENQFKKNRQIFELACKEYEATILAAESDHLFETFIAFTDAFFLDADVALNLIVHGQIKQAQKHVVTNADASFIAAIESLEQLRRANEKSARKAFQNTSMVYGQGKIVLLIAILIVSICTFLIARFMRFGIFVPILKLTKAISRLAAWELDVEIPEQHRRDELGNMANSITLLQKTAREQEQTSWIKVQLQEIIQTTQKVDQIEEFANALLNKLSPTLEAQIAAFYALAPLENSYKLCASYGMVLKTGQATSFRIGEGLIGQCAGEKTIKIVCDLPPDCLSIDSGIVKFAPSQLVIAPILSPGTEVLAILEFGFVNGIKPRQHELLKELMPILGLSLQVIERNQHTRFLLNESQRQAIELSKQAEQIFIDQQEMQKPHDRLLQTNAELAGKTRELERTLEKLEEATQVKGVFLANMSHEIRTPMNAVIGMSHLCLKTELTAKQKDYVEKIQQAGYSLLEIINNILDFSKLEDGNMKMRTSLFNLDEFLDKITLEFSAKAKNKGLEFITEIDGRLPAALYADSTRIAQILNQLLANAIKFTASGQVTLKVDFMDRKTDQIKLRFEVRDTGIGMDQAQISQLFKPFKQADESSTRKFSGTGIGLALAKRLIEMMDGSIQAEAQPGIGSTFSFELWCKIASPSQQPVKISIEGLHVMVVDDNPIDQQILKEQLDLSGMRVDLCSSGSEALQALKQADTQDPFALIFMDWRLPGTDGVDIIRQIESLPLKSARPVVIMVTAFEIEDIRDQAEIVGVKAFLPKPVTPSNLWNSLVKALGVPIARTDIVQKQENVNKLLLGMRVLLVEDNDLNQQIAKELLLSAGIAVTIADNGKTALELLRSAPDPLPYDLVLMDLQMPVMDGHQATIELRKDPRFKELPIIALTAHAMEEEKQNCFDEGMNGHISKPIEPQLLFRMLAGWTKQKPAPDIDSVPMLDAKAGLRRVAGNQKLYANLLQKFCEGQAEVISKIRNSSSSGDNISAQRLAHTLKGISGNIGASALQKIADSIEKAAKAGTRFEDLKDKLIECEETFNRTVAEIRATTTIYSGEAEPEVAARPITSEIDTSSAARLLKKLHYLLSQSDGESEDFLNQNEVALQSLLGAADINKLRDSLSRFDFDQAISGLLASAHAKKLKF